MSFFDNILQTLGLRKKESVSTPASTSAKPRVSVDLGAKATAGPSAPSRSSGPTGTSYTPGQTAVKEAPPRAISEVDVVRQLEDRAAGSGLNWKTSIVDLLKLLDIDSSLEARKELATELGAPADVKSDSARLNVWLHKTVLRKIAENGGNIPQSLLD